MTKRFSQIAIVDGDTPKSIEFYKKMRAIGVNDVIVTLSLPGYSSYLEVAEIHTDIARRMGMRVHAALSTDLRNQFLVNSNLFVTYKNICNNTDVSITK